MKNAVTKSLSDPLLEAMPVIPTDRMQGDRTQVTAPIQDLIAEALQGRPELAESDVDLVKPPDQPEGGAQCIVTIARAGRLLRRLRARGSIESSLSTLHFQCAGRFRGSTGKHIQQFFPRLLYRFEPEYPDPKSGGQG